MILNQSRDHLSEITEIPELKHQLEQAEKVEKEFEKLVLGHLDEKDLKLEESNPTDNDKSDDSSSDSDKDE